MSAYAIALIVDQEGRFLIIQESGKDYWQFPAWEGVNSERSKVERNIAVLINTEEAQTSKRIRQISLPNIESKISIYQLNEPDDFISENLNIGKISRGNHKWLLPTELNEYKWIENQKFIFVVNGESENKASDKAITYHQINKIGALLEEKRIEEATEYILELANKIGTDRYDERKEIELEALIQLFRINRTKFLNQNGLIPNSELSDFNKQITYGLIEIKQMLFKLVGIDHSNISHFTIHKANTLKMKLVCGDLKAIISSYEEFREQDPSIRIMDLSNLSNLERKTRIGVYDSKNDFISEIPIIEELLLSIFKYELALIESDIKSEGRKFQQ